METRGPLRLPFNTDFGVWLAVRVYAGAATSSQLDSLTLLSSLICALAGCCAAGQGSMEPTRGVMASRIWLRNI